MANINKNKQVHFLYKSTNTLNGNYYIGIHSTNKIDDSYIGSGTRFRKEVGKYGKQNFKREILDFFNSREDALAAEYRVVSEVILDVNCLNLCQGGRVGGLNEEARRLSKEKRDWLRKHDKEWNKKVSTNVSTGLRIHYENRPGTFTGRTHKSESIEKIKAAAKNRGIGKTNSQYGTCWITNETENKKINRTDIIPDGWRLGRVIRNKY